MFWSRQAITITTNSCLLIANRRHFLFSQLKKFTIKKYHHFGSLNLLELKKDDGKRQRQQQFAQVGRSSSSNSKLFLLLEQQKRFFASSSSSFAGKLAHRSLYLDTAHTKLHLKLNQGERSKFFTLRKVFETGKRDIPSMALEVGYPLVSAMDALLNTLVAQKREEINQFSSDEQQQLGPVVLASQRVKADFYDFQLEIVRLDNGPYLLKIKSIKTVKEDHKEREMLLPIRVLPWLRAAMAQMLVEHDADGSSKHQLLLGPAPPELPESILMKARLPTAAVQTRPQLHNNQRQQHQQQFASPQKPSATAESPPTSPFYGQQQFHQSRSSTFFGAAPLPKQQQHITQMNRQQQPQRWANKTANQQNSFQSKKPANQAKNQQIPGQWNRQPQRPIISQNHQQIAGPGQAPRMANSSSSINARVRNATTTPAAGNRGVSVASVPLPQQQQQKVPQNGSKMNRTEDINKEEAEEEKRAEEEVEDDDIFKLLSEVEALAKEVEEEKARRRMSATSNGGGDDNGGRRRRR